MHTLPATQHTGVGLGSRDESDTVPAHGEPTVCRRGLYTHKLPSSEVAGDQCAETGTRDKMGLGGACWGVRGGLFLSSDLGLKRKPEIRAFGAELQLLWLSWFILVGPASRLPSLPAGLTESQPPPPPFLQCYILAQSFGVCVLKGGSGRTHFLL